MISGVFFWVVIVFLLLLCIFLIWKLYKFSLIILSTEEAIEASLDILDEKYKRMSEILEKPIFFDSLEVRQVISDIKDSRNSILYIANILTDNLGTSIETQKKENSNKG